MVGDHADIVDFVFRDEAFLSSAEVVEKDVGVGFLAVDVQIRERGAPAFVRPDHAVALDFESELANRVDCKLLGRLSSQVVHDDITAVGIRLVVVHPHDAVAGDVGSALFLEAGGDRDFYSGGDVVEVDVGGDLVGVVVRVVGGVA